jgi:hypothetical protein
LQRFIAEAIQINENQVMKFYLLPLLIFCVYTGHAQVKNNYKTRQVEQLQQLKETVTRTIDTMHLQLMEQADSIEDIRRRLDQLRKESNYPDKHDLASKGQASKNSPEPLTVTVNNLQKKFDQRMVQLDKAVNLQKDLEDKISTLVRESNQ